MRIKFNILLFLICSAFPLQAENQPNSSELQDLKTLQEKVSGKILFQSNRDHLWQIYQIDADGRHLKRISDGKSNDQNPVWSSKVCRIYFSSDRSGTYQIYSVNEKGEDIQKITEGNKEERLCNLNRDASKLLFQINKKEAMKAFIRDLSDKTVHEIDFSQFSGRQGKIFPMLSPDGQKIAFLFKGGEGAKRAVYVGDLDSNYRLKNSTPIHLGCFISWSKDSAHFVMCFFAPGGTALYLVKADGSEFVPLTEAGRWNYFPCGSPDEKWIAWSASPTEHHEYEEGPYYDIYIASLENRKPIRLTFQTGADLVTSWRE